MSIYVGTNKINDLYRGTTTSDCYVGQTQIWPTGWQPGANTVAYYKFEDSLNDSSNNGRNLTSNGYPFSYASGVSGKCGYSESASFSAEAPFTDSVFAGNFTLMFFIKFPSIASVYRIMGCNGTAYTNINYESSFGGLQWYNYTSAGRTSWTRTPSANTWYHIAIVGNGTNYSAYLDGTPMTKTVQGNVSQGGQNLLLFNNYSSTDSYGMVGYLDEVIIEDKIWSAQEIADYYNQIKGNYGF